MGLGAPHNSPQQAKQIQKKKKEQIRTDAKYKHTESTEEVKPE